VLGLAGLGAGAVAVYLTHVEAGPAALLVVGLILLLIAMSGLIPNQIRFGDIAIDLRAVEDFVERAADTAPAKSREFVAALHDLEIRAPEVARAGSEAAAYKDMVILAIDQQLAVLDALPRLQASGEGSGLSPQLVRALPGGRFDLLFEAPDRVVVVEIRSSTRMLSPEWIEDLARQMTYEAELRQKRVVGLLITRTDVRSDVRDAIGKRSGQIQHVVVADHEGWIDLWNAVAIIAGRGSAENAQ
jgi:hypothetical protein